MAGSNSTQATSPISGSIFLLQQIIERYFATRIGVINNFRADIRSPIDRLRLVLGSEPMHFGNQVFQAIVLEWNRLPDAQVAPFHHDFDLRACLQPGSLGRRLGNANSEAVAPFGELDLHTIGSIGYTMYIQTPRPSSPILMKRWHLAPRCPYQSLTSPPVPARWRRC